MAAIVTAELWSTAVGISLVAGLCSCAPSQPSAAPESRGPQSAPEPAKDAETAFSELEERLLGGGLELSHHLVAEGAIEVDLRGRLWVGDQVELLATGTFAGEAYDLRLSTRGDLLHGGPNTDPSFERPRPTALVPSLVLGLTRMGLLHNVAMLVSGAPPDHSDGGVGDWVQVVEPRWTEDGEGLTFGIVVAGEPSGTATLWLDDEGLPRRREQTVPFPEGEMRVVETYESVRLPSLGRG